MKAHFETPLVIKAICNFAWELVSNLVFVDERGNRWVVPAGFRCDMASVPRLFWIFMPPSSGVSDSAAAVHDMAVRFRKILGLSYMDCHQLFLEGLAVTAQGKSKLQRLRYWARRNIAYSAVVAANWVCLDDGYGLHSDPKYNVDGIVQKVIDLHPHRINPDRFKLPCHAHEQ